jgi:hypothetical protein
MHLFRPVLSVLLLVLAVGCGDPDDQRPDAAAAPADAATAIDGAVPGDAAADAGTDALPGACDLARTAQCPGGAIRAQATCDGPPIEVGAYCDDVVACAPDEAAALDMMRTAPAFVCDPLPPGAEVCPAGAYRCTWQTPGTIDAADLATICAVTVLPTPPEQVQCLIYI